MAERTAALVLRQVNVGEADRILTLLTAPRGRLDVRAGGVRRSRKRFGGLDLFVLVDVAMVPGRTPPRLAEAEVRRDFAGLRGDVLALALASYAVELIRQAAQPEQESASLFALAEAALSSLDGGAACPGWAQGFEAKLLHVLGARPALRRCAMSGLPAAPPMRWSPELGGVICGDALPEAPTARDIAPETVSCLDRALRTPLADQPSVPWTAAAASQGREALRRFLDHHLAPPGRAWSFLQGVLPLVFLALAGCAAPLPPTAVSVSGFLYSTPTPEGDAALRVAGAGGTAWDDSGELIGHATAPFSDFPAFLRFADLPPAASIQLVIDPPDDRFVPTVVTGRSEERDLIVEEGTLHLHTRERVDGWIDQWSPFADVPALDPRSAGGGIVRGVVADAASFEGLRIVVSSPSGGAWEARYTDADGAPSGRDGLSSDGGFYVCCVPDGPIDVIVLQAGAQAGGAFTSRAVEDGVTSMPTLELQP